MSIQSDVTHRARAGVKRALKTRVAQHRGATKLRRSLLPGTVLIILAGRFRGKRVIALKALDDGVLLVTGPFKINGVPLRRVNAAYVLATSTRIELPDLNLDKFKMEYFRREKNPIKKGAEDLLENKKTKSSVGEERIADQKYVDSKLVEAIHKIPHLKDYLAASFSLSKYDRPHLMKF